MRTLLIISVLLINLTSFAQRSIGNNSGTGVVMPDLTELTNKTYIRGVNPKDFGAVGNGIIDDRNAIVAAIQYANSVGADITFPSGTYKISKYILINGLSNLKITSNGNAKILYPSNSASLNNDAEATITKAAKSAFLVKNCDNIIFESLNIEGVRNPRQSGAFNIGKAFTIDNSKNIRIVNCKLLYGGGLVYQYRNTNDRGLIISNCYVKNTFDVSALGSESIIENTTFEVSDSSYYDRPTTEHAIYIHAGRDNITIKNCIFKNIRNTAVKVSGTSLPVKNIKVIDCYFDDCGAAVIYGADDIATTNRHDYFILRGNTFKNCATNRSGWNEEKAVWVLGSSNVLIDGNVWIYTRNSIASGNLGAIKIWQYRIDGLSRDVYNVKVINNSIVTESDTVDTGAFGMFFEGLNLFNPGQCIISNNTLINGSGIYTNNCNNVTVENNLIDNPTVALSFTNTNCLFVEQNQIAVGNNTSAQGAPLRLNGCGFFNLKNNIVSDWVEATSVFSNFNHQYENTNNGLIPIQINKGFVKPTLGYDEVVFCYGAGWTNGDYLIVNSDTLFYGVDFTNKSTMITAINSISGLYAEDYGFFISTTSNFIRIRTTVINGSDEQVFIKRGNNFRNIAGILLHNASSAGESKYTLSVGSNTKQMVIWSPSITTSSVVAIIPYNASATALIQNGYTITTTSANVGACTTITFVDAPTGAEIFQYLIQ